MFERINRLPAKQIHAVTLLIHVDNTKWVTWIQQIYVISLLNLSLSVWWNILAILKYRMLGMVHYTWLVNYWKYRMKYRMLGMVHYTWLVNYWSCQNATRK